MFTEDDPLDPYPGAGLPEPRATEAQQAVLDAVIAQYRQDTQPGDHVVCDCGQLHERDFCPTRDGAGMAR